MKITIKSKKSRAIEESIEISDETTSNITLKTLRVFLLKTFRHFPANFNFETPGNILYSRGKSNLIDPVIAQISLYNLKLQFEVAPDKGWYPSWRTPLIIGSVFASFLLSLGLLRYLLVSERHIKLLNSMLPIQAVKHLEIEDKVFAEHFNLATILFADIVGYTVIASSLTPIQVVALLDELYTIFDKLVKTHGIYKGYFTYYSIFSFKIHSKHIYSHTTINNAYLS
jgi:hypothetical protein